MWAVVNRQAIDMVGRAGVDRVVNLDHVAAVGRQRDVQKRVETEDVPALGQLGPRRRQNANRRVQPALDPLGLEVQEQPLSLLALERKTIDVGAAVDLAVDHRVDAIAPAFSGVLLGSASIDSGRSPTTNMRGLLTP